MSKQASYQDVRACLTAHSPSVCSSREAPGRKQKAQMHGLHFEWDAVIVRWVGALMKLSTTSKAGGGSQATEK